MSPKHSELLSSMGRKAGKKKRSAAQKNKRGENPLPIVAPLVDDVAVFNGNFVLQVPEGWRRQAVATSLSEQFVSRRALRGGGVATTLMMDLAPAYIRDTGPPSGDQRLMKFLRFQEAENDPTFNEGGVVISAMQPPFVRGWLVDYLVGKLQGHTTRAAAILLESPETDVILRLYNGDAERVSLPEIIASLRRVRGASLPTIVSKPEEPIPVTIKLDFDELEAVAKGEGLKVKFLWLVCQAMCYSPAELGSMNAAARQKVDVLLGCEDFARHRLAALKVPAVRRRIQDVQRARTASEKGPSQAASEPVDDPRARAISVAVAVAKAAAKAIPPHENATENPRWVRAVQTLRDAITTDDSDEENFYEYMESRTYDGPENMLKGMTRWPRLRKYWPRLRRRICSFCGTRTFDLSKPRFLACGGCAAGRGVGRYCSETCQRADWPEHQEACTLIHTMPDEGHPWMRKVPHTMLFAGVKEAKSAGLSPEGMSEADLADRMLSLSLQYAKKWKSEGKM